MKSIRLVVAVGLALTALVSVVLALAWWQPATVRAKDGTAAPAAPQTLPLPWLSDEDVADAPFNWPPTVDGRIDPGEYAGAGKVSFPGYGGEVEVFLKQDAITLYVAIDSPDTTPYPFNSGSGTGPALQVFLDTAYDRASIPQVDDYRLTVSKDGSLSENQGTGSGWSGTGTSQWNAHVYTTTWGWQAELAIDLSKLGITPGVPMSIGLAVAEVWTPAWPHDWYWPQGGDWDEPDTWGTLVSSSDWSTFYWKPGPWEDYAPSGMPDFDQMQAGPTFCGPVAVANSLWWFDSKFESNAVVPPPGGPPATIPVSDSYTLVHPYGTWDDHDPQNVAPLALDLGTYFGTDVTAPGTNIYDMYTGIQRYLRERELWDEYVVTLVNQPDFEWIAEEVMRSEDVVLLLGFWEWLDPDGIPDSGDEHWARIGGHYVTVAGVDPATFRLALSDPAQDAAETFAFPSPSRVLSGTLMQHYPPHPSIPLIPGIHNDAGNVSHDVYFVSPDSPSPGGIWYIENYEMPFVFWDLPPGFNPNPRWEIPHPGTPYGEIHTEIEYALAVSPFTWKASGRWVEAEDIPLYGERFEPFDDFSPSGVPDFCQMQDSWGTGGPPPAPATFCGPAAAANSLWWFDSKFEYDGAVPPTISDTYPLVEAYADIWDDHDPRNVGNNGSVDGLVEDLAGRFQTDNLAGTLNTDLAAGIEQYLVDHGLRHGYVITQANSPDFWWVAEEVERSEDVILLLGFWQSQNDEWVRLGGHYVTVPGVDKQGGFVAFSDPYLDRMETALPPGEFIGWPTWTGRVGSDGDPPVGASGLVPAYTHTPLPHTGVYTLHNDAANVSHDVYAVNTTDSPGGVWGPRMYVDLWPDFANFEGLNGAPTGAWDGDLDNPVQTEVDWAVAVSPVADVWLTKTVTPPIVAPGEWVTFTIAFGNAGSLPARDVVLTDTLPTGLVDVSWDYRTDSGLPVTLRGGTSTVWDVPILRWGEGGVISVTAQVDPSVAWPAVTPLSNDVVIGTSSVEQYQLAPLPNLGSASFTVRHRYDVDLTPETASHWRLNGETAVYTFTVRNTSTTSDTYSLSVAGDEWTTSLSTSSVGPVAPNATASFQVSVTVPATAVGGDFDQATVTAQSVTTSTVSDTSTFTTRAAFYYAMYLNPASGSLTDNPGETVTYTLTINNAGNISDTYDLLHTLAVWPTSLSVSSVGPVAPGSYESFRVYVTIPGSASDGAQDVVTVTANSQGSTPTSDSVLTTVATKQVITRGVEIAPHTATGSGDPGDTITYTLRVTNTGSVADVIGLSHTGPSAWTVAYSANPLSLGAGMGTDVDVTVGIPSGATLGSSGVITITATSQGDSAKHDAAVLTTKVSQRNIYLPIVMRNCSSP